MAHRTVQLLLAALLSVLALALLLSPTGALEAVAQEASTEIANTATGEEDGSPAAGEEALLVAGLQLGAELAKAVDTRAVSLIPPARDPIVALLRTGELSPESARALGRDLELLSTREGLEALHLELQGARDRLDQAVRQLGRSQQAATQLANRLFQLQEEQPLAAPRLHVQQALIGALSEGVAAQQNSLARSEAGLRFVSLRLSALELEAARAEAVQSGADEVGEAGEERARLLQSQEETQVIEARARQAERRAQEERQAAQDEFSEHIAARWGEVQERLDQVTVRRAAHEQQIAELAVRRENFGRKRLELEQALAEIRSASSRLERSQRADALIDSLVQYRDESRGSAERRAENARRLLQVQVDEEAALNALRQRLNEEELRTLGAPGERRIRAQEVAAEELRAAEEALELARQEAETAQRTEWVVKDQIHYYARAVDQVVPSLSRGRAWELFRFNADNLKEARLNAVERTVGLTNALRNRVRGESAVDVGGRRVAFWMPLVGAFVVAFLLIRTASRRRDAIVLAFVSLRMNPRLGRFSALILKGGEILHESIEAIGGIVAAVVVERLFRDAPVISMLASWWFWIAGYQFVIRSAHTVFIPRENRPVVMVGEYPNLVRLGVDLFRLSEERGRLIVGTLRLVGLYLVGGQLGLAAIKAYLGPGFVHYWVNWLFMIALLVLVYALLWTWRTAIVDTFVARRGDASPGLAAWIRKNENRPHVVLVLFVIVLWLLLKGLGRMAADWASGRGPGRFIANLVVRRRFERVAEAGATVVEDRLPPPPEYLAAFEDEPLTDERFRIERPGASASARGAFGGWLQDRSRGALAIVGDSGSGKTSFAWKVAEEFKEEIREAASKGEESSRTTQELLPPLDERSVETFTVEQRLADTESVMAWVASKLGLGCAPNQQAVVEAIEELPPRVVIVDQCENFFIRRVGGFAGIDSFFELCTLTNHRIFWVLVFDRYSWNFLHRVGDRRARFREIVTLSPLDADRLRELIMSRSETTGLSPSFDLLAGNEGAIGNTLELVRTDAGYFRLLAEYSQGNLRVAMQAWLDSLSADPSGELHVSLFPRPDSRVIKQLNDEQLFVLVVLAQHRAITVEDLTAVLDIRGPAAEVLLNVLVEDGLVRRSSRQRYHLATRTFIPVLDRLKAENYLHLD